MIFEISVPRLFFGFNLWISSKTNPKKRGLFSFQREGKFNEREKSEKDKRVFKNFPEI